MISPDGSSERAVRVDQLLSPASFSARSRRSTSLISSAPDRRYAPSSDSPQTSSTPRTSFHCRSETSPPKRYQRSFWRTMSSGHCNEELAGRLRAHPHGLSARHLHPCDRRVRGHEHIDLEHRLQEDDVERALLADGVVDQFAVDVELALQCRHEGRDVLPSQRRETSRTTSR